ncbi:MAG: DNA repair protein RecO [Alphaproteobacteria bacterium]
MEWSDDGIVLAARRHGEHALIVQLLTREHGRHAGLVRGGAGSRQRGTYQPGNLVSAQWRGRLPEHLGAYVCELKRSHAGALLDDPLRLAALSSACAVGEAALPDREPHGPVFEGFLALLEALAGGQAWGEVYIRWELGVLAELGYGLDLSICAATGRNDELAYVSPKSGRAVSLSAGEPYRDKLLPLPAFLTGGGDLTSPNNFIQSELTQGLQLTAYFLESRLFAALDRSLPAARQRLAERVARAAV